MSSSPSYVLMASMDRCIRMLQEQGTELFGHYKILLDEFDRNAEKLRILRRVKTDDPSKIIITCPDGQLSGMQIAGLLREKYHIEPEMTAPCYVLCLSSVGDDEEGFHRLAEALSEEDRRLRVSERSAENTFSAGNADPVIPGKTAENTFSAGTGDPVIPGKAVENTFSVGTGAPDIPEKAMEIFEAWDLPAERTETVPLEDSAGRVSCEFAYLYPPGIPLIAPGEIIPEEIPVFLARCIREGFELQGLSDPELKNVRVLRKKRS